MRVSSSDVSDLVSRLMAEKGIGTRELSRKMGFSSHSRLSDRLKGKASWKLEEVFPLAEAFGIRPEQILNELQGESRE